MAAMVAITNTVIVANPVSRREAQEIRETSCLTCLTNCAGDTLAINRVSFLPGYTYYNTYDTPKNGLPRAASIVVAFLIDAAI
jgi:hypothetical protein